MSRYIFCPMTSKHIGRRATLAYRFRRWRKERKDRKNAPDVYQVIGYRQPIYPGK